MAKQLLDVTDLEKAISIVFGGTTRFDVEDAHARYFDHTDQRKINYKFKIVHDGSSESGIEGEIWYRMAEWEDWYDTGCDEKYLESELRKYEQQQKDEIAG